MSADWIDGAFSQIVNQLGQKESDSPKDIYVWSDGSVTGPKENADSDVEALRLVGVFSPNEEPSESAIRETLENGMRAARDSVADEKAANESGTRPAVLPATTVAPKR
jgi:hypothetical protein